jgi:tetratricopeptide (TPR) repeat protein
MMRLRVSPRNALLAFLGAACSREPQGVGPVPRFEPAAVDTEAAAVILRCAEEAERSPDDAGARGRLGLAYDANGAPRAARAAFRQAAALDPKEPRWSYHLARMRAATGDLPGALESIDVVLGLAADYAPAHLWRGDWCLDAGRIDEAERSYRNAARLDPEGTAAAIGLARVHIQRGEDRVAIEILEELLGRVSGDPYVYQLLGIALRRAGDQDLAREAYRRAANPAKLGWPDPWTEERDRYRVGFAAELERATALAAGEEPERGIEILERLRPEHPEDVALLSNLGAAYCKTGRLTEGIEALEAAVRLRPGHFTSLVNLSQAWEGTGRLDEALRVADDTVEEHPWLALSHMRRGQVLARLGRKEEALESFRTARRVDERSTTSLFWAGVLRCELGRWQEAVRDFETLLEEDPRLVGTHLWLARARAEAGDLVRARESLEQASRSTPAAPELAQIRARIEDLERRKGGRR